MFRLSGRLMLAALAFVAMPLWTSAKAQTYPSRPVTIIVPLAAGTGMDTLARLYGEQLSQTLGKPVVIENKPGAALMLGMAVVAAAPPDGHTLGIATSGPMAIGPALYKKINYDPTKDFAPIHLYVKSPLVLVVDPALPIKSVSELIQYAKASANPMSYSTPGAGAFQHLSTEFMAQRFGLKMTHVPYRSSPQSIADIAAGHVNLGFAEAGASLPLIRDGKLRALAPDFEAVSWHVLLAPAGTPKEIIDRLHHEMKRIMSAPDMQQRTSNIGLLPIDSPSIEGIRQYIKSEQDKWGSLVKKLGLEGSQ